MTANQLSLYTAPSPPAPDRVLEKLGRGTAARDLESQQLEFKQPKTTIKDTLAMLADAAVCFANADGGLIILGVDDKATKRTEALVGVPLDYSVEIIRRGIFDRTSPPLTLILNERIEDGVRLLALEVPAGVAIHSNSAGLATRRLGKECRPFTPEQQREFLAARGQLDWSAEPSGVPLDRLARDELRRMRTLLGEAGSDELVRLRDRRLLEALNLIAPDGTATNAALLLLGHDGDLTRVVPNYGHSYQYRPTPGSEATSRNRGQRPILAAVEHLLESVEARTQIRPLSATGGVQLQLIDYPPRAVREFVVNAFIHRSYEVAGTVDVEHSPERLIITNPGGLVAGVTPNNILTHPSTPRHRLLTETVSRCQLAERTGQGIDRAYREMLRAGKAPPRIEDLEGRVGATVTGGIGNDAFVRFLRDLPDELSGDVEILIALSLLRDSGTLDAQVLATSIQRGPVEAQDVLERMADDRYALLEPTRRTMRKAFPAYRLRNQPLADLSRAVSYRRGRSMDETDAKIVEHVREYGYVTNKTLQRLFDLNVYGARNMLTVLRDRGLLKKLGKARGGPGVKYGPGSKFPSQKRSGKASTAKKKSGPRERAGTKKLTPNC